jgi:hypothetical protein
MTEASFNELVKRVEILERLLFQGPQHPKDWRSAIGMFADNPEMKEIFEEGRKIREAEREAARQEPLE